MQIIPNRAPVVAVEDEGGNLVAVSNVPVHLFIVEAGLSDPPAPPNGVEWNQICKSDYRGTMQVHGLPVNLTTVVSTASGLASFSGLAFSRAAAGVRLRFCALKMKMDDAFSEASLVSADSPPFDIAGTTEQLGLIRHPAIAMSMEAPPAVAANSSRQGSPLAGDVAGEIFRVQPELRLVDGNGRNATWCSSPYRSLQLREDSPDSNSTWYRNASVRFSLFDRDKDLTWAADEFNAYSTAYGGSFNLDAVDTDRNSVVQQRELVEYLMTAQSAPSDSWRFHRYVCQYVCMDEWMDGCM